ncbi:hypothetical protein [Paludibacterium purpuratum]|uniref:Lipoprotein n=1 Tax=Paludibacterium purpuratum TaxID=1144873 RepID=A0A4R7B5J0_9NEIS|nr:hypothetical protein [Paludibacterium purpuratum]TDR79940.1 hypothetical protein DFP86_10679 [Paludibacterium purpuratum]
MNIKSTLCALACAATMSGCASFNTPSYTPDYNAIDALKAAQIGKVAVNTVQPEDPAADVNHINLRGSHLTVEGGTFASYLQQAITSDLTEAGVYDPNADTKLVIELLENDINVAGFATGTGVLVVNLQVLQHGKVVLDKKYSAHSQFDSSFAAALAIPNGQNAYPGLVKKLLSTIYSDHQFIDVLQQSAVK